MTNSIVVRMNLNTYRRIRATFPAEKGESVREYFQRLAKFLENGMRWTEHEVVSWSRR